MIKFKKYFIMIVALSLQSFLSCSGEKEVEFLEIMSLSFLSPVIICPLISYILFYFGNKLTSTGEKGFLNKTNKGSFIGAYLGYFLGFFFGALLSFSFNVSYYVFFFVIFLSSTFLGAVVGYYISKDDNMNTNI
jgi:hypothetical protein